MGELIPGLIFAKLVIAHAVLVIVPLWRVFGRAGFSPALSLLVVIPGFGFLIVAAVLGFGEWPSLKNGGSV
ncbi:MAG TPA: hypothetical protein VK466_09195 [Terriglobales bacterium]|nr:hypothetical protein [Terriglobales bacterium]